MIELPCGCKRNLLVGTLLKVCLRSGWFNLFDRLHEKTARKICA
jgi:hypothetical protein